MLNLATARQEEISRYMTQHLWVVEYKPDSGTYWMMKEPYAYSQGPFEVMAVGKTLEEAFDKARIQQENNFEKELDRMVDSDMDHSREEEED